MNPVQTWQSVSICPSDKAGLLPSTTEYTKELGKYNLWLIVYLCLSYSSDIEEAEKSKGNIKGWCIPWNKEYHKEIKTSELEEVVSIDNNV